MDETWWTKPEQLDKDQKNVVELGVRGSHLILGPPGSGKTNLILLRATYMARAGRPNVLILLFTRTLQEFLKSGGKRYPFSADKIQTYFGWGKRLLSESGVRFEGGEGFARDRIKLLSKISKLAGDQQLKGLYDAILLDEAHDYYPEEIMIFRRLGKTLFAVADSRQKVYDSPDCLESLRSVVDKEHVLRFHYRNGIKICKLADEMAKASSLYEPMSSTAHYDERKIPSSVEFLKCKDIEEQGDKIVKALGLQMKAYPGELLGVLCPRHEELRVIWEFISQSKFTDVAVYQTSEDGYVPFEEDTRICVCTLHSAKGLEFRALHIAGMEYVKKFAKQKNLCYTGVTRAKTSLSVYYTKDLPGYLEGAYAAITPPPEPPKLTDLFKKEVE